MAIFLVCMGTASQAASTTFNVTVMVLDDCAVSAGDLAFASYSTASPPP